MMGRKRREQMDLFVSGSLEQLIPEDHILRQVDRVLDLSWLPEEVGECYCADNGRPGLDPEVVVRLMLAGFLLGYVQDRRLLREAQAHLAIRWFHRVQAGRGVAGSFEPDADTSALGGGSVSGDIPSHGSGLRGGEGGEGGSGSHGCFVDTCGRELGESGGAPREQGGAGRTTRRMRRGRRAKAAGVRVR